MLAAGVVLAATASGCRVVEAEDPPPPPPPRSVMCGGLPPVEVCYGPEELRRVGGNFSPPRLGPLPVPPMPPQVPHIDRFGCMAAQDVTNACCMGAYDGPRFDGLKCCYRFCSGGCC